MTTDLGARLRERRLAAGLTPSEAARRAGVSRSHIYHLEEGSVTHPSALVLGRLADAIGVTLYDLLGPSRSTRPAEADALPQALVAYLEATQVEEPVAAALRAVAWHCSGVTTERDWAYLAESLRLTVFAPSRRRDP
jgi:transcriptional regulator with XRE-family HTH domain